MTTRSTCSTRGPASDASIPVGASRTGCAGGRSRGRFYHGQHAPAAPGIRHPAREGGRRNLVSRERRTIAGYRGNARINAVRGLARWLPERLTAHHSFAVNMTLKPVKALAR
jgi:hypothetical protein